MHPEYCGYGAPSGPDWACLLDDHLRGLDQATGRQTYIGIGADRDFAEIERQIALGRQRGAKVFAIYAYSALTTRGHWARLASGPFREPAAVPARPWKPAGTLTARAGGR